MIAQLVRTSWDGGVLALMTALLEPQLTFTIDPSRSVPFYHQLQDQLRAYIFSGVLRPDRVIPSERELMRLTGLSRMTVRQAVAQLTHEGLLRRDHGRGTFVVPTIVHQDVEGVYSFTDRVRAQGRVPSTQVLQAEIVEASHDVAFALEIGHGDPVIRLVRLRLVDGLPMMLDVAHLPERRFPKLLEHDLAGSLYAVLAHKYGRPPTRSTDILEAVGASPEIAAALDVEPGAPLILMQRLALSTDGKPIEYTSEYGRPDRCRYRISLVSEAPFIELTESAVFRSESDHSGGTKQ